MKNYISMYVNGKLHRVYGEDIFLPLSDYLRSNLHLKGTKEVCVEGDCGACTVLIGKLENKKINYKTIDSCICYVYQLNKCHVVTVEGIKNSKLNPVQEAMVKCHGAQCGYCTPGFVVSLCSFFNSVSNNSKSLTKSDIQKSLIGNLCRCTGYETIIEAGLSVNKESVERVDEIYPDKNMQEMTCEEKVIVVIETKNRKFYEPATLQDALRLKRENNDAKLLAGGTDLHVMCNKKDLNPEKIIFLSNLKELRKIEANKNCLTVGAAVTLAEFESFASKYYPGLEEFLELFASDQIKNIATLAGNVANASPIGDTLPFLLVMNAELVLENESTKRKVNINNFYKGYKVLDMKPDEIITHVNIPFLSPREILRLYKVSKRKHLDISSFSAVIKIEKDSEYIKSISIAFGGVGPTVQRMVNLEKYLTGKKFTEKTFEEAAKLIGTSISPISDVRGSKEYRLELAKNSLLKFYFDLLQDKKEVLV